MDKLRRDQDIETIVISGESWVRAGTGGVSTSEFAGPLRGKWWELDAGYDYGALLLVWNDYDRYWSWEPAADMRLSDFAQALRATHRYFVRV